MIRVTLERLAPGGLFGFWFNPRRGNWHGELGEQLRPAWFVRDVTSGPGASAREFTPPTQGAGEDWVLVLSRRELGSAN